MKSHNIFCKADAFSLDGMSYDYSGLPLTVSASSRAVMISSMLWPLISITFQPKLFHFSGRGFEKKTSDELLKEIKEGYGPAGEWLPLWQKIAAVDYQYASRFDEMYEELMASPELTECRTYYSGIEAERMKFYSDIVSGISVEKNVRNLSVTMISETVSARRTARHGRVCQDIRFKNPGFWKMQDDATLIHAMQRAVVRSAV